MMTEADWREDWTIQRLKELLTQETHTHKDWRAIDDAIKSLGEKGESIAADMGYTKIVINYPGDSLRKRFLLEQEGIDARSRA